MDDRHRRPRDLKVVVLMDRQEKGKAAKPKARAASKGDYLVVRVDEAQKDRIRQLSAEQEQTMSNFIRDVVLKLTRGWKLIPPE